jgi:hypothetical protein
MRSVLDYALASLLQVDAAGLGISCSAEFVILPNEFDDPEVLGRFTAVEGQLGFSRGPNRRKPH